MKSVLGLVTVGCFSALAAQDPSGKLEEARDRLITEIPSEPQYVCVQTMERSYSIFGVSRTRHPASNSDQQALPRTSGGGNLIIQIELGWTFP